MPLLKAEESMCDQFHFKHKTNPQTTGGQQSQDFQGVLKEPSNDLALYFYEVGGLTRGRF